MERTGSKRLRKQRLLFQAEYEDTELDEEHALARSVNRQISQYTNTCLSTMPQMQFAD